MSKKAKKYFITKVYGLCPKGTTYLLDISDFRTEQIPDFFIINQDNDYSNLYLPITRHQDVFTFVFTSRGFEDSMEQVEFEWDQGNLEKIKIRFTVEEIETFFLQELETIEDLDHSNSEKRIIAVGIGPNDKPMFVCYTIRETKIRVISARCMRIKEANKYETFKKSR